MQLGNRQLFISQNYVFDLIAFKASHCNESDCILSQLVNDENQTSMVNKYWLSSLTQL